MSRSNLLFSTDADETDELFSNSTATSTSSSASKSGLSGLFSPASPSTDATKSLVYQPPKQPQSQPQVQPQQQKKATPQQTVKEEPAAVIHAIPIQLFQFEPSTSKFKDRGKVGAAILGNKVRFQVLLYDNNKQHICVTSITKDFNFTIQNNVYGSFYDDTKQNWSLLFRSLEECVKFSTHVAVAKAAVGEFKTITTQEVVTGPKGKGITNGDVVRIKYSGWLCDSTGQIGTMFDSNVNDKDASWKFKLGEGPVKGIDEGIKGMKKGGKRIIVTSVDTGYTKNPPQNVPAAAPLVFEVELLGIKRADTPAKQKDLDDESVLSSSPTNVEETVALPVTQNENNQKADLVARMAKLGRPAMGGVVPVKQNRNDPSEEESATPVEAPQPQQQQQQQFQPQQQQQQFQPQQPQHFQVQSSPQAPVQVLPQAPVQVLPPQQATFSPQMQSQYNPATPGLQYHQHAFPDTSSAMVQQSPVAQQQFPPQSMLSYNPQLAAVQQSVHPLSPYSGAQALSTQDFSSLNSSNLQRDWRSNLPFSGISNSAVGTDAIQILMEERQFHNDIRANISNLSNKLNDIFNKLDRSNLFQAPGGKNELSGLLLIQNIQRIVDENEKVKQELNQKTEYVDSLREKIAQLHEKNEKFIEENNRIMEQRNMTLKESSEQTRKRLIELLEEKAKLEKEFNEASLSLSDVNRQHATLNRLHTNLKADFAACQEELAKKHSELEALKSSKMALENSNTELSIKLESERLAKQQLETTIELLKSDLEKSRSELLKSRNDTLNKEEEFATKLAAAERTWRKEKSTLDETIKELQDKIEVQKQERLTAAGVTQDQISKLEQEFEVKWKAIVANKETEVTEKMQKEYAVQLEQQRKAWEEESTVQLKRSKETWEREAFERGVNEGKKYTPSSGMSANEDELLKKFKAEADEKRSEVIKKIMNGVYFKLYEEFEEDESYKGELILSSLMRTMKETTLQVLGGDTKTTEAPKEEEQEEEEDNKEVSERKQSDAEKEQERVEKEESNDRVEEENKAPVTTEEDSQNKEEDTKEKVEQTEERTVSTDSFANFLTDNNL